jgi:hypothetical protein
VSTQTELSPKTLAGIEARPPSKPTAPSAPPKEEQLAEPRAYWGDRLTIKFWLFCFALMFGITLVEALRSFVLFLLGRS